MIAYYLCRLKEESELWSQGGLIHIRSDVQIRENQCRTFLASGIEISTGRVIERSCTYWTILSCISFERFSLIEDVSRRLTEPKDLSISLWLRRRLFLDSSVRLSPSSLIKQSNGSVLYLGLEKSTVRKFRSCALTTVLFIRLFLPIPVRPLSRIVFI